MHAYIYLCTYKMPLSIKFTIVPLFYTLFNALYHAFYIYNPMYFILSIIFYQKKNKKNSLKKIFLDLQKMEYFKRIIEFFYNRIILAKVEIKF